MDCVVVTGASAGIGAACVEAFQRLGAEVVGVDVVEESAADLHLVIDLGDPDCGRRLLRLIGNRPVVGLVNNAAVQFNAPVEETTPADFDRIYRVNVRGPFLLAGALHPNLSERNGFVVNVASVHAVATSKHISAYAASKGALASMTRALAVEWAPEVRVNAVLPGAIETEMLVEGFSRSGTTLHQLAEGHPMKRVGRPDEIANAVTFLAASEFVTGSLITIDGGATARLSTE